MVRYLSHLSEWLSSINQQTTRTGEDVEKREAFCTVWWGCRLLQPLWKTGWTYLKKLKMDLPFDPAIPGDISKGIQNTNSKEHKHPCVQCSIIYNYQDTEAAQVSISTWVDKTTMWHLHNGILLGYKKEECFTLWDSMDETGKHVKWNKPVRERQIPYDSTHMWNLMSNLN